RFQGRDPQEPGRQPEVAADEAPGEAHLIRRLTGSTRAFLALLLLVVLAACGSSGKTTPRSTATTQGDQLQPNTGPAPWPAPLNSRKWIVASGLPALPNERLEFH